MDWRCICFAIVLNLVFFKKGYISFGDFFSGIAGRLGAEVIGHFMDDNRFSYCLLRIKAFRVEGHKCASVISEQNRKISGMHRMRTVCRVVVRISLVKMETEDLFGAGTFCVGKSGHADVYKSALPERIKADGSFQVGVFGFGKLCPGDRLFIELNACRFDPSAFHVSVPVQSETGQETGLSKLGLKA